MTRNQSRKGFTLIEILIVVIILGILAAIVIPQFTNASKEAKQSALVTMVQSLRSQISLFKLQHNDYLPGCNPVTGVAFDQTTFWNQMTLFSNLAGDTKAAKDQANGYVYGPYMQSTPVNPLNSSSTVAAAAAAGVGFVYDYAAGAGSGKIWGVDSTGALINQ
jgi:general secretion pathway protein G